MTKTTFRSNHMTIEDGNGDTISAEFNSIGQLVSFSDGDGNIYTVARNENQTLKSIVFPDGTNKSYTYTTQGHILKTQNDERKTYSFDNKGRLVMKDLGDGLITSYKYDDNGYPVTFENPHGKIDITYNEARINSVTFQNSKTNYVYNDVGLLQEITSSYGYFARYEYNAFRQVRKLTDKNNKTLLSVEYTDAGKIKQKVLGNNATVVYEYDNATGLLGSLTNHFPNGSIASFFAYTYSSRNRRIAVESNEGSWKFQYDRAGQVISMTDPQGHVTKFRYDSRKNRRSVLKDGVEKQTDINNMNQYLRYGDTDIIHDKNGNVIQKQSNNQTSNYTYDADNRIIAFENSYGSKCTFRYNALGNLFEKDCNGKRTRFVYSTGESLGSNIIEKVFDYS